MTDNGIAGIRVIAGQDNSSNNYSLRDDFTVSFTMRGRHDVKVGGEYIYGITGSNNCATCMGLIDAQGGPVPANIEDLIPVWNDVTTWNLAALTPITRRYTFGAGLFRYAFDENNFASWVQDDWAVTNAIQRGDSAEALKQIALSMDSGGIPYKILGQLAWFVREKLSVIDPRRVPAAVEALFRTDLDLKSSGGDPRVLLERLVVELCRR